MCPIGCQHGANANVRFGGKAVTEQWLDKKGIAKHLSCSTRSIELAIVDGMPHAIIFGRAKFHASEVETWLEETGRLDRRGIVSGNGNGPAVR
jgi:hypothetical protein